MQEKIKNLEERIDNISNIKGDNDISNPKDKSKSKTIDDIITNIKSQIIDNSAMGNDTLNKSKNYFLIILSNSEKYCSFNQC